MKILLTSLVLCLPACWGDAEGLRARDIIGQDVFIAAYVDLRVAALSSEDGEITDEGRTAVLSRHEVSDIDLLNFAEYHAKDLPFMREVWDEIEVRLDTLRHAGDDPGPG